MNNNIQNKALLPAGFSDKLYPKSQREFIIVEKILNFFSNYSFLRVSPPLIEFEETLISEGPGSVLKENSFRIMDPISRKMMALRSDMTTQISRISSTRMANYPRPLRISYSGDILRVKSTKLNSDRQITQVGAEIIGEINYFLEAEIILIGLKTLNSLNVKNISIDLNYPTLRNDLLEKCPSDIFDKVDEAIKRKDLNFLKKVNFPNKLEILNLMINSNYFENKKTYIEKLTKKNKENMKIIHLLSIAKMIKENFKYINIIIDPLETNLYNYHDGMTFTIYSKGIKDSVARGGTYKTLTGEQATGISIYTELINDIPDLIKKKNKILLKPFDFDKAESLIQDDYEIVFSAKLNESNYKEVAREVNCNYVFFNNKITKIE